MGITTANPEGRHLYGRVVFRVSSIPSDCKISLSIRSFGAAWVVGDISLSDGPLNIKSYPEPLELRQLSVDELSIVIYIGRTKPNCQLLIGANIATSGGIKSVDGRAEIPPGCELQLLSEEGFYSAMSGEWSLKVT